MILFDSAIENEASGPEHARSASVLQPTEKSATAWESPALQSMHAQYQAESNEIKHGKVLVEHICGMFRQALKKQERKLYLRDAMMVLFRTFLINRWEAFYRTLYEPGKGIRVEAVLKER